MSYEHTPGPWKAEGSERTLASWVKGADGKRVCTMRESEQDWPNARLIAAAPDLLVALERIANSVTIVLTAQAFPQKLRPGMHAIVDEARAALSRARGTA